MIPSCGSHEIRERRESGRTGAGRQQEKKGMATRAFILAVIEMFLHADSDAKKVLMHERQ